MSPVRNTVDTWGPVVKGIVTLQDGEYLLKITGTAGAYLDSITFHTNLGTYGPFGGSGGHRFRSISPQPEADWDHWSLWQSTSMASEP